MLNLTDNDTYSQIVVQHQTKLPHKYLKMLNNPNYYDKYAGHCIFLFNFIFNYLNTY